MSFQQKSIWIPRDASFMTNGEMSYESSSKIEPKRSHQWFMDGTAPELLSSKRQATESVKEGLIPEVSPVGVSSWDNTANIQPISGQFTDRMFGSQPIQSATLDDQNIASFGAGDTKYVGNQFANGSSMSLSMSHGIDDPSSFFHYGGLRKVRINQVREQEKSIPAPMESFYRMGNDMTDSNVISLGPSHPDMNENSISMATGYSKGDDCFISMGQSFSKEDGNFISMGHNYNRGSENILSMGHPQPFPGDGGFISMGETCSKGDRDNGSFIPMAHSYVKAAENFISMNPLQNKDNDDMLSIGHSYDKGNANIVEIDATSTYEKGDSGNTICFGGFNDEAEASASGAIIGNFELVLDTEEGSVQASEVPEQTALVDSNADPNPIVNTNTSSNSNVNSRADKPPKNKDPKVAKKLPPNNFPSNVKSLLSTGILDGVPVKYVSWSREKNLKAIIKGTGYLCGCNDCNNTKSLNAYEFERHAGCKTKHPNNHIYFDNGKTIYAVVQELKSTPQDMLFNSIQNVTGSPINQKNFRIWKASYQAATRELQRIYGNDEVQMPGYCNFI